MSKQQAVLKTSKNKGSSTSNNTNNAIEPTLANTPHFEIGKKADYLFLIVTLLIALILRLDFQIANNFIIDADEAIVGLMAKHILEGQPIPIFYYGQEYMGSFEALLVSISFYFFGITNFALKAVPITFSLFFVYLTYLIGREIGGRYVGRLSALLVAIPPSTLLIWSAKARGGFIELMCIGALALLVTIYWLKQEKPLYRHTILTGLLLGFGWWVNNQIIYFMLPIGFVYVARLIHEQSTSMFSKLRSLLAHGVTGFSFFILGGLPFWIYNFKNEFSSFNMFGSTSNISEQLTGFFATALPILFGAKRIWQQIDAFPYSTLIVWIIYGTLFSLLLYSRRKQVLNLCKLSVDCKQPIELLGLFLIACGGVFVLSSFGWLSEAPRYLLPMYLGLFILIALAIDTIRQHSVYSARILIILLLTINLLSCYYGGRALPGEPFVAKGERVAKDHSELINWLNNNQHEWVYTNYWIGYRLAFETKEEVKFLHAYKPYSRRIKSYTELGIDRNILNTPLVLVPSQAEFVVNGLTTLGYNFETTSKSGYTIIHSLSVPDSQLTPIDLATSSVKVSSNYEMASKAIDENRATRWGSAKPQEKGMFFEIELQSPTKLKALHIDLGKWQHDFPRELSIIVTTEAGKEVTILDSQDYEAVRYVTELNESTPFFFESVVVSKIRLIQTGSNPVFDWSIAELILFS